MESHMRHIEGACARTLISFMHHLSQERWFAGWLTSTPEDLWDFHEKGVSAAAEHPEWCLSQCEVDALRGLAAGANAWPMWSDGGLEMVDLSTWRNARKMDAFVRDGWDDEEAQQ